MSGMQDNEVFKRLVEINDSLAPAPWCVAAVGGAIRHVQRNTDVMDDYRDEAEEPDKSGNLPNRHDGAPLAELRNLLPWIIEHLSIERALEIFGKDKQLSLAYHDKFYGDDDDLPTHGKWVIWRETGNINDREWEVVSSGDTPAAAIRALVKP